MAAYELRETVSNIKKILSKASLAISKNQQLYWINYSRRNRGYKLSKSSEIERDLHLKTFADCYPVGQRIWPLLQPKVTHEDVQQAISEVGPHLYGLLISAALLMQVRDGISGYLSRTITVLRRLYDHLKYKNNYLAEDLNNKMQKDPSQVTDQGFSPLWKLADG